MLKDQSWIILSLAKSKTTLYHYIDTVLPNQQTVLEITSNFQHILIFCRNVTKNSHLFCNKKGGLLRMAVRLDRRKKYTRMVLKDSLMHLLNQKPLSAITVKEICMEADINRSTFYTHYKDPLDLLHQIEEEIIEEMNKHLTECNFAKEEESLQLTETLLEYIIEQKHVCQTLLNQNTGTSFQKRVMIIAKQILMDHAVTEKSDRTDYFITFIISGAIHVIKDWLNNGTKQSPKEMAELINLFVNR